MATIRKRSQTWQCRIQRNGFPEVTKTFVTKEDAQKWARAVERSMDLGEFTLKEDRTFKLGDLIDRYEREVTPSKKGSAQERYRLAIIKRDPISNLDTQEFNATDAAAFRERRLNKVKPVTVHHDLCTLSAVLEHARLEWFLPITNPVRNIRKPSLGRGRERRLSKDEETKLRDSLARSKNQLILNIVEMALETACRRSELLNLRWENINLIKRVALLQDTKTGDDRLVPLSSRAISILQSLPKNDDRVFPTNGESVTRAFINASRRAGISNLRFHDLRHEGVSRLFELGLNPIEVSSISGHKTLACLKRYAHAQTAELALRLG